MPLCPVCTGLVRNPVLRSDRPETSQLLSCAWCPIIYTSPTSNKVSADEWTSLGALRSWKYKTLGCKRSEAFRAAKIHPVVSWLMAKCGPGQHLLPPCSTPKEALWCSEILVATHQTTRCRNSKYRNRTHYTKNKKITAQFCMVLKLGDLGK